MAFPPHAPASGCALAAAALAAAPCAAGTQLLVQGRAGSAGGAWMGGSGG